MGAKSNFSVSERREIILSLLRREEPAAILHDGMGYQRTPYIAGVGTMGTMGTMDSHE
jgi:hypothetical protein